MTTLSSNEDISVKFVVDSHLVNSTGGQFLIKTKEVNYRNNVTKAGETITARKQGTLLVKTQQGK